MSKPRRLVWNGHRYASKEHCTIDVAPDEILIRGQIRSRPADIDLRMSYLIVLTPTWETVRVRIAGSFDKKAIDYDFGRIGDIWTNWDGMQLSGRATDTDISLTPLTNTLPIRRLQLKAGERAGTDVLYFDLGERTVDIRQQRYTRLDARRYLFETVPNDFEATIEVDDEGFVLEYPGLFSRA